MARKLTAAEKTQLATTRANGFAEGTEVTIKSGGQQLVGVVTASNGFITNVRWTNPVLGREVIASWTTRAVKFANMI